ncbi:hypothetical protein ACIRIU_19665 [Streptomyces sp. NPDC102351]|uniref:hypothetical protein n=1 Tax=Streptomyces sp. NPDC102351 TaxID=3366158 RepID=UPI0037FDB68F
MSQASHPDRLAASLPTAASRIRCLSPAVRAGSPDQPQMRLDGVFEVLGGSGAVEPPVGGGGQTQGGSLAAGGVGGGGQGGRGRCRGRGYRVCEVLNHELLPKNIEGTRPRLKRLVKLSVLTEVDVGSFTSGRYFWCSDGLIVREPGINNMTQVIAGLLVSGEFEQVLQRLDDE